MRQIINLAIILFPILGTLYAAEAAKPATVTVYHNNVLVQEGFAFSNPTQAGILKLQDHSNPVRYRNIWFLPAQADAKP